MASSPLLEAIGNALETQYRALLADKPNHADALHMLGLLHF